jgi:hypothetical protein
MPPDQSALIQRLVEAGLDPRYATSIVGNLEDPVASRILQDLAPIPMAERMGWFACPNAVFEFGLTPIEGWILAYLVRRAGPDGGSFPAMGTIARECDVHKRTVQRTVAELVRRGIIVIHRRRGPSGVDTTNVYRLRFRKRKTQPTGRTNVGRVAHDRPQGGTRPPRSTSTALKVDKDKDLSTMASPVDNPNGTDPEGGTDVRLLKQRFDTTPEAIPPDLHQIIAKWVLAVSRTTDNQRDKRTREAVKTLIEITGWSEEQVRQAMTKVADDLSPTPAPTP